MATQMQTDKILSMIDVIGSKEKFQQYKSTVEKVYTGPENKDRYWMMYAKIAQEWINSPKINDKRQVLSCLFNAVKLGLNPDPVFGEIYFVPYKGVLTYQIGYKGMIKLSLNSGKVTNVRSGIVYEKDEWEYYEDEKGQHYKFKPNFLETNRGRELFIYSIFADQNGVPNVHVMDSQHVDKIKAMVLARTPNSPWANALFEPEMRKKTCIRRHWKTEPKSVEIAQVMEYEEKIESGEVIKEQHTELEGIIDDLIDRSQQQEEVLPMDEVFGKAKA